MGKSALKLAACGLFAALAMPLLAQPQEGAERKEVATLRIENGVVMVSEGGAFVSAAPGQRLFENERVMVSNDSKAKVVWDDGCEQTYDRPGVYSVDRDCKAVAADWRVTPPLAIAAVLVGGGVAAAIINDRGHKDPPPDPPASR